jgi:pyridoxine 5-phosphate synthase
VKALSDCGARVSLFIDPDPAQIESAMALGAPVVELHTGRYCEAYLRGDAASAAKELGRLADAARMAGQSGLEVHAGHGLDYETAVHLAALPQVKELNIGHFLIGEAVFDGLPKAISRMLAAIQKGVDLRALPAKPA